MARPENDGSVRFLYGTALGRGLLKTIQVLHMDRLAVWFLRSGLSRPYMAKFAKKNQIPISKEELKAFPTYRDFFCGSGSRILWTRTPATSSAPAMAG